MSSGAFSGLRNLSLLQLSNNNNLSLNNNSLRELKSLRVTYTDKTLPDLSNLRAMNRCGIKEIPTQLYERLSTVGMVYLSFNKLTSLPEIENYNKDIMYRNMHIYMLHLNGNKLSYIRAASIKYVHNLRTIDNQISYIEPYSLSY